MCKSFNESAKIFRAPEVTIGYAARPHAKIMRLSFSGWRLFGQNIKKILRTSVIVVLFCLPCLVWFFRSIDSFEEKRKVHCYASKYKQSPTAETQSHDLCVGAGGISNCNLWRSKNLRTLAKAFAHGGVPSFIRA